MTFNLVERQWGEHSFIPFISTSLSFTIIVGTVLCWSGHSLYFSFHVLCCQQKPQIGYKDLMKGYHNKVNTLAGPKNKTEVTLVINLFQSVLDGFIRGEIKRVESEPAKVSLRISFQSAASKLLDKYELSHHSLVSHFWLHSGFQDGQEEEEKGQMCKLNFLTFIVKFSLYTSQCLVCTSSLYSLIILWITCSAHTR